jgi:CheY-like chemotaxis protein
MDLNMPGLDGWMAMSLIKARRPALPIIILTAMTEGDLEARAKTAGAAGFLTKPCNPDALARAVARAIRG